MALSPERKMKRDAKIKTKFFALSDIKTKQGKRKLSYEAIIGQLADEFDLSEYWIGQIVKGK